MSDNLINFSPGEKIVSVKLPSPLIPVPSDDKTTDKQQVSTLVLTEDGMDDNPFDKALHDAAEYTRKKDDPFEAVLEKALNPEDNVKGDKSFSSTPRSKKNRKKINQDNSMNKRILFQASTTDKEEKINFEVNSAMLKRQDGEMVIPEINVSSVGNLSILDASQLDDSLTSSASMKTKDVCSSSKALLQRSFTQLYTGKLHSPLSTKPRIRSDSNFSDGYSVPSILSSSEVFLNLSAFPRDSSSSISSITTNSRIDHSTMNKGFIRNPCSSVSTCSTQSRLDSDSLSAFFNDDVFDNNSSIRSNSISSRLSSVTSCDTSNFTTGRADILNRGFLNSVSSAKSVCLEEHHTNPTSAIRSKSTNGETDVIVTRDVEISQVLGKCFKLDENVLNGTAVDNGLERSNEKLIDVDVFVKPLSKDENRKGSSSSTESSDSVFSDNQSNDKSIFKEATALAKTFEDLSLGVNTQSSSSAIDDLLNNTKWESDLLPAFDEEDQVVVNNLIELPESPIKENAGESSDFAKEPPKEDAAGYKRVIEELERELLSDMKPDDDKQVAVKLLEDLNNLIKAENKPEALKLLDSLKQVLGVKQKHSSSELTTADDVIPKDGRENGETDTKLSAGVEDDTSVSSTVEICETNEPEVMTDSPKQVPDIVQGLTKFFSQQNSESNHEILETLVKALNIATGQTLGKSVTPKRKEIRRRSSIHSPMGSRSSSISYKEKSMIETTPKRSYSLSRSPRTSTPTVRYNVKSSPRELKKRFSSDPGSNNHSSSKLDGSLKSTKVNQSLMSEKTAAMLPLPKVAKPVMYDLSKSKLKAKSSFLTAMKKGPLKAILPLGNMQKGKVSTASSALVTPPKSSRSASQVCTITSSTPDSATRMAKKDGKPIASSTPDYRNSSYLMKQRSPHNSNTSKRSSSCEGSPTPARPSLNKFSPRKLSPNKRNLSLSHAYSSKPKYSAIPRRSSASDLGKFTSPKSKLTKSMTSEKQVASDTTKHEPGQSPLKSINKSMSDIKPCNLISKLQFSSNENLGPEKENNLVT